MRKLPVVPLRDIVIFLKQFSTLLGSGVPIVKTMNILINQTTNKCLKIALISVYHDIVEEGLQFYQAFKKFPSIFSALFCGMVQIGEMTGTLPSAITRLLFWYEKELKLRIKVVSVLFYPAIVTLICMVSMVFVMIYILPKIIEFLVVSGFKIPLPTRILIFIEENFFKNYFFLILVGLIFLGFFYFKYRLRRSEQLRSYFLKYLIRIPVFSRVYNRILLSRFCKSMYFLLAAGIRAEYALKISGFMLKNSIYQEKIEQIVEEIKEGKTLSMAFKDARVFPSIIEGCVAIGAEIGKLPLFFMHIGDFYEMEIDIVLEQVVALIEPAIMIFMGFFTLAVVASIFLPIYSTI